MVTIIEWYVEREIRVLSNKPYLTEFYIDLMKNEPESIKKALLENLKYDIALAIHSGEISDFNVDEKNKESFVEDVFKAIKDAFIKD